MTAPLVTIPIDLSRVTPVYGHETVSVSVHGTATVYIVDSKQNVQVLTFPAEDYYYSPPRTIEVRRG